MGNHLEISSNLEIAIKKGLKIAQNIVQVWVSSHFDNKTKIQKLVFPEGIAYDRQKNEFRTFRVKIIFSLIADVARFRGKKNRSTVES
jgi:site-specific DNA recombinase